MKQLAWQSAGLGIFVKNGQTATLIERAATNKLSMNFSGAVKNRDYCDVIIVGAGISGIDAAYHLQTYCPKKSFLILESRHTIGGTWDLFRYPGIRSDSDMQTFSFGFKPWQQHQSISEARLIMDYLEETVAENDIAQHICFQHKVLKADWSSQNKHWTITIEQTDINQIIELNCNFLFLCTGYYDYKEGYTPDYKGLENFKGRFVHPQKWTDDIVYKDKKVIVIGSGATAVTLVPALAKQAQQVIMLQRSPSYVISRPAEDKWANIFHRFLPAKAAHFLGRWKNILMGIYFFNVSRRRPDAVKKYLMKQIKKNWERIMI